MDTCSQVIPFHFVPTGLISTGTPAYPRSPLLPPTKRTGFFGKSTLRFMTYLYSARYEAPSTRQLHGCDKASHGDSGVGADGVRKKFKTIR